MSERSQGQKREKESGVVGIYDDHPIDNKSLG